MEKNTKYQILKYVLTFSLLLFSLFLWRSVDRAIFEEGASVWMVPSIWASLFFSTFSLAVFFIKEKYFLYLPIALSFLSSLYFSFAAFSFSIFQFLFLIISSLLSIHALNKMKDDFNSRLKIDLGKNIRSGSALIIFSLSLAISLQYYFETKDLAIEKYLPQLEIGKESNRWMLKMVSNFLPQADGLADDNLTVDQFLIGIYEKQKSKNATSDSSIEAQLKGLNPAQRTLAEKTIKDAENNMVLEQGKKQLSQLIFREVGGGEKISDVFSEIVNKKINAYFIPGLGRQENSSLFSAIIAIVIFLTATSIGSFLMFFWILAVKLIFFILKQSGIISIVMVPTEKEVVE